MRFLLLILCAFFALACRTETAVNGPNLSVKNNSVVNTNQAVNSSKQPASSTATAGSSNSIPIYTYEVVNTYKHDSNAFTQGLFFHNGFLYETTGQEKKSNLRKVEIESGRVLQQYNLPRESFGEGSTLLNGKIYQVTWQEERGFVYDLESFNLLREFTYQGQGWGLTNDGKNLIMSDGSHLLKFFDPETFQITRTVPVFREDGKPLMDLNELEYVNGEIWANVWHSEEIDKPNHIARIDPQSGRIVGWINLDGISPDDVQRDRENTLNGIAFDPATGRIFVTGKKWKKLFEIKIKPKE